MPAALPPFAPASADLAAALRDVRSRPARAPNRLVALQDLLRSRLGTHGIRAGSEVVVPGAFKERVWDVAELAPARGRIAVSCRSVFSDHTGAGANRLDELLGEAVDVHRRDPQAVLGNLIVASHLDEGRTAARRRSANPDLRDRQLEVSDRWFAAFGHTLASLGPRLEPKEDAERWEAMALLQVKFDGPADPYLVRWHPACQDLDGLVRRLAGLAATRRQGAAS